MAKGKKPSANPAVRMISLVLRVVLSAVLLGITAGLMWLIVQLGVLPPMYRNIIFGVIIVIDVLLLWCQIANKARIVSKILMVILSAVLLLGAVALNSMLSTMHAVSNDNETVDMMAVYVMTDDSAQSLQDASDYNFGILKLLDRSNTDGCIDQMKEELSSDITTTEFDSPLALANALQSGEINAIIMNTAYMGLIEDQEGLESFSQQLRQIWSCEFRRTLSADTAQDEQTDDRPITERPFILYISGNDTSGTLQSTGRSDVNILMAINPKTHEILMVNTPRDYYVPLSVSGGERDKLTHAGIYGVDVSMDALSTLYGVPVEYYARLNFTGFKNIIDALGGITVESPKAFRSNDGRYFSKGSNDLNGAEALSFARERYAFGEGDNQRGKNQMTVIRAVIDKASSPAILTGYLDVMEAASGTFQTNMSQDEISSLVQMQLSDGTGWKIQSIAVSGEGSMGPCFSMPTDNVWRMIPNEDDVANASTQLKAFLAEQPYTAD